MRTILALALKDLRVLSRDWAGMFWIVAFPLMFALFFGAVMGGMGERSRAMQVAVVDEDKSEGARDYIAQLEKSPALKIERMEKDAAVAAVRKGDGPIAYVLLKPGFGKGSVVPPFIPGLGAKTETPVLEVGIDPTRRAEGGYLHGLLVEAAFGRMRAQLPGPMAVSAKDWSPVTIKTVSVTHEGSRPRSAFEISFPSSILWGIMGCAMGFAISIVVERVGGTWLRLQAAPLTTSQILLGKGLACFLANMAVTIGLLLVAALLLDVRLGNPLLLLMAVVSTSLCFTGMMLLFSTMGKTEAGVAGAGWGVITPMAMLGGGMIPLIAMPDWMLTASNVSPVKWGIIALEGAIWRDFGFLDMLAPCAVLVGIGAVCYVLGWRLLAGRSV